MRSPCVQLFSTHYSKKKRVAETVPAITNPQTTHAVLQARNESYKTESKFSSISKVNSPPKISQNDSFHFISSPWICFIQKMGILLLKSNHNMNMLYASLKTS